MKIDEAKKNLQVDQEKAPEQMSMAQRVAALNKALAGGGQSEEKKQAPIAPVKVDAASTNSEGVAPENMTMAQRVAALNKSLAK